MKRSTLLVLALAGALLASFAVTAAAMASVAGPPRYISCNKAAKVEMKYTGAYSDKSCTTEAPGHEGKYELGTLTKLPAKVKDTVGKVDIYLYNPMTKKPEAHFECASGKASGALTSAGGGELTISYSSCKATGQLAGPCNSPGQKSGVVVSNALASRLEWLNESQTEPGIALRPAKEGGSISTVLCAGGAETAELVGALTGRIAPTSAVSKAQTLTFAASEATGEPEFAGGWENDVFTSEPLLTNLSGVKTFSNVPSSQNSVFSQKGPAVLIGA